jgi:hypothetical protein
MLGLDGSSAISRNATTGFLSRSRSIVSSRRPKSARALARQENQVEAVRDLVDTIFDGNARHEHSGGWQMLWREARPLDAWCVSSTFAGGGPATYAGPVKQAAVPPLEQEKRCETTVKAGQRLSKTLRLSISRSALTD